MRIHYTLLLLVASPALGQALPDALKRIQDERASWRTGRVEWSLHNVLSGRENVAQHSTEFAGPDTLTVYRSTGSGTSDRCRSSLGILSDDGQYDVWQYRDGSVSADVFARSRRSGALWDVRAFGLGPNLPSSDVADVLTDSGAIQKYEVRQEGALTVVVGTTKTDRIRWELDPEKGGLPTRITRESKDSTVESRIDLRRYGERWYPATIQTFHSRDNGGKTPSSTVEVHDFAVNVPGIPERFSPAYIGIDAGVTVDKSIIRENKLEHAGDFRWDGTRLLTSDEFDDRLESGAFALGPMFLANCARLTEEHELRRLTQSEGGLNPAGTAPVARKEDPLAGWEQYTQDFIQRFDLSADQRQVALRILRECQERGHAHLKQIRRELDAVEARIAAAGKGTSQPTAGARGAPETGPGASAALCAQRDKLLAPINEIFEKQLKPRLEEIPTRAQRAKAGAGRKP